MIKVSHYFLKALHSAFLLKIIECSELGFIERNFIIKVDDIVIHIEVKGEVKKNGALVLIEGEESRD